MTPQPLALLGAATRRLRLGLRRQQTGNERHLYSPSLPSTRVLCLGLDLGTRYRTTKGRDARAAKGTLNDQLVLRRGQHLRNCRGDARGRR